ncbi:recombinase family protein [Bacteroidota bacterium]
MKKNLDDFKQFAKKVNAEIKKSNLVWGYTRVSSKDQYENNSLTNQKNALHKFADEYGYSIEKFFGGTYESASGDFTRKEFLKMFEELKSSKKRPYAILVFKMSRFSRTGAGGIALLDKLTSKYNVHLIETSSCSSTDAEDQKLSLLQSLLDANKENYNKLETTIPGMKSFLKCGNWLGKAPRGYDHFGQRVKDYNRISEKQKIVLNEEGKILQNAWYWKLDGASDAEIIARLNQSEVHITKQRLSSMWRNPFYCAVTVHELLDNEPVRGNWEPMIPHKVFWDVQEIISKNHQGYQHSKENERFPLSNFVRCSICDGRMTYYTNKKKNLDYYRCNICKGMNINANSTVRSVRKGAHELFLEMMNLYALDVKYIPLFKKQLQLTFDYLNSHQIKDAEINKKKLKLLEGELSAMIIRYSRGKLEKQYFELGKRKIEEEMTTCKEIIDTSELNLSNLLNYIDQSLEICSNIHNYWKRAPFKVKKELQKLVFPNGIFLSESKSHYLTKNTNSVFSAIHLFTSSYADTKKGLSNKIIEKSLLVAGAELRIHFIAFIPLLLNLIKYIQYGQ